MYFFNALEQYFEIIPSFPFVLQVALYFIFFNSVIALVFLASIYMIRKSKDKEEKLEQELYPKQKALVLQMMTTETDLTAGDVSETYEQENGKLNDKTSLTLVTAIEDLVKENPDFLTNKNYNNIIRGLKIEEFLINKLDTSNIRLRLRTFQSLATLSLTSPDSSILPHTYSRNTSLRKESRNYYLAISNHDPFKFFDYADNSLNHWDQIHLLEQLEAHHKYNLPNFSKWIKYSKNKSQLVFVIKAASYFNQRSAIPSLVCLLKGDNHEVRKEAIKALGDMRVQEVEEKLKALYENQPVSCQNAIIEAIAKIASQNSLEFLKSVYFEANNLDTKKLIAEVIYRYNAEGKAFIENLYPIETGFNKLILDHIKNPLIPSRLKISEERSSYDYNSPGLNFSI